MSQDMYDMIILNNAIPHIDGLEEPLAIAHKISKSLNVAGMSASFSTTDSGAVSIHTQPLEGTVTVCNMVSSILDNAMVKSTATTIETLQTIYDSPAMQAASETTHTISDHLPSEFLEKSLEVNETIMTDTVSPVTNKTYNSIDLFAGITQFISDSIASYIQELYEHMREFLHDIAERFKHFIEDFFSYCTETRLLPVVITYDPVHSINCTEPPIKIPKFCTYSYKIRKTYLRLSRERGSSDDANYTLTFSNNIIFAPC